MMNDPNSSNIRLSEIFLAEFVKAEEIILEAAKYPIGEIVPFLANADVKIRARVAQALRHSQNLDAVEPLLQLLSDPDIDVSGEAAVGIIRITHFSPEFVQMPRMLDVLIEASKDSWVDREAVRILSWIDDPRAAQALVDALQFVEEQTRFAEPIRDGLIRFGKAATEMLIPALKYEEPSARELAAEILGELGNDIAIAPLLRTLHNDDEESYVQYAAAVSIGKLGGLEALVIALKDKNQHVRLAAVEALGNLQHKPAIEPIKELLSDSVPEVREAAEKSLAQLTSANDE